MFLAFKQHQRYATLPLDKTHQRPKFIETRLQIAAPLPSDFVGLCHKILRITLPRDLIAGGIKLIVPECHSSIAVDSTQVATDFPIHNRDSNPRSASSEVYVSALGGVYFCP